MMKYSVSVIIPCYNSAKFISKTLNSVLNQTYKPHEILSIDDGSTDETRNILEGYSSQIKILCHPNNANLGTAASMNLGVVHASSDLIAFLDHDDLWYPTKLMDQIKIFDKYPDIGLVYTNGYAIDENDNKLFQIFPDGFQELNKPDQLLLRCYIKTSSIVMVRRSLFEQTGLFRTDLQAADHDMWTRMSEITNFYYLPKCLAAHRKHPGQLTSKRRIWEDGFDILRQACKRYPYSISVKRKRLAVLHYRLGEYDWNHNSYWRAITHFLLAAMFDPERSIEFVVSSLSRGKTEGSGLHSSRNS